MPRTCHHPNRRARQERALARRRAELKRLEAGEIPTAEGWQKDETGEASGRKAACAKAEIANLRAKGIA